MSATSAVTQPPGDRIARSGAALAGFASFATHDPCGPGQIGNRRVAGGVQDITIDRNSDPRQSFDIDQDDTRDRPPTAARLDDQMSAQDGNARGGEHLLRHVVP